MIQKTPLYDLLVELLDYMDKRADVVSTPNEDGSYSGNKEMYFATQLEEWVTDIECDKTCPECDGTGEMMYSCCTDEPVDSDYALCPVCREHLGESDCNTCEGKGKVPITITL